MPRRPSKKLKGNKPRHVKRSDAKLARWEIADDIPLDEEDAFHASRNKVLLDGDAYGDDGDGDDEEVFALKDLERGDDDEDEDEKDYGEDYGDEDETVTSSILSKPKKKDKKKKKEKEKNSDDEEEEETWGRGKAAYYSSNAAQLESDDEEGQELEEQEARRLQKKALAGVSEDDYGLNDKHEIPKTDDPLEEAAEASSSVVASLPQDRRSLIRHLEKTNPEALALARDWDDTVMTLMKTRKRIAQLQSTKPDMLSAGMAHLHYQALLTYTTTLAFYLHLRASPKYARRPELLTSHPIMQRLLTLKQSVSTLEDLGFTLSDSEPEFDEDDDESLDLTDEERNVDGLWHVDSKKGLEPGELDGLLEDAQMSVSFAEPKPKPFSVQPLEMKPPKKKRKLLSEATIDAVTPIFDLEEPEFAPPSKPSTRSRIHSDLDDAYGEATRLQSVDAADKSARKKSLRFHTSKIESTSARRQGARSQAMGGDDDIPYRERQKEKEARLLREAKNRIQRQGGDDLDDSEPPEHKPEKRRRNDDSDGEDNSDDPDGYYELVRKKTKESKEQKKAKYEATRATERIVEESLDGPRSLTRAILTNKGLTPHRSKAVRNPRVKKRQKFEKAKKRLASQKAVYKGGLSQTGGRYDGEKSGISKVVKSVKLG